MSPNERQSDRDEAEADPLEDEGPGPYDLDDADSDGLAACPSCGRSLWARVHKCHHCGHLMAGEAWEESPAGEHHPAWKLAAVITVMAFVLFVILMAL